MKIKEFLSRLVTAVNSEIAGTPIVELANIATLNDGDEFLSSKSSIILSIVNIEEDKILKNQTLYKNQPSSGGTVEKYKNPTQNLILSLLFASYNIDQSKYTEGIDKLEVVIRYFQNKNVFYWQSPNLLENMPETGPYDKIVFEMVSLKMDQLNQMWSCLGSRYIPSVLYRVQMLSIQAEETSSDRIIEKAGIRLWENNRNDPAGLLESAAFMKDANNEIIPTT